LNFYHWLRLLKEKLLPNQHTRVIVREIN
jgi:hypothetical protein